MDLDLNPQLSPHFKLWEFVVSEAAERRGIDNTPPPGAVANLKCLCQGVLEPIRDAVGRIRILSGYRSVAVNTLVGGTPGSQHTMGEAADWAPLETSMEEALAEARRLAGFDQLIREFPPGGWIHISWRAGPVKRRTVLVAQRVPGGGVRYSPLT